MDIPGIFQTPEFRQENAKRYHSSLMFWCMYSFRGVKALFTQFRIERRLGKKTFMMRGKFKLSEAEPIKYTLPGFYLLRGFKKHRMPSERREKE